MSTSTSKYGLDLEAIHRIAVYMYARCNACIVHYEKYEEGGTVQFRMVEEDGRPKPGWTPNFGGLDSEAAQRFFPDIFVGCDLILCLPSWSAMDFDNLSVFRQVKNTPILSDISVFVCEGSDDEFNGVPRTDYWLSPEHIALREELIAQGRYIRSVPINFSSSRHPQPNVPDTIIPLLQQLFSEEGSV